jgi:hypothetical protein
MKERTGSISKDTAKKVKSSHIMSGGLIPMTKHLPLMVAALDCVDHVRSMKTN